MAESKFIKLTAFGGYDVEDVDKRLEMLYGLIYNLKNDIREAKTLVKKYEEGADVDKAYENAIAVERAQLTQLQVKNEKLTEKNRLLKDDLKAKEQENTELKERNEALMKELDEVKSKLGALAGGNSSESLGVIFMEAQKSREMIIATAKQEAAAEKKAVDDAVERLIVDSNNKAAKIIYEAETEAADIVAEARNKSEQMRVAEGNMRASMLDKAGFISAELAKLKEALSAFETAGGELIEKSEQLIAGTESSLKEGGVPVFEAPQTFAPEYPQEPEYAPLPGKAPEPQPESNKNDALDKLQAMAESIDKNKTETAPETQKADPNPQKLDSLDKLQAMAEAIGKRSEDAPAQPAEKKNTADETKKPQETAADDQKKKGGMDLTDLLKQAYSLTD